MSAKAVSIEGCTAFQLVGQETIEIAKGTLSLGPFGDDESSAPLLLKIAESSFALPVEKDAIVGTRGDRTYLFSKKLATEAPTPDSDLTKVEGELKDVPLETEDDKAAKPDVEPVLLVQIDMPATASEADLTEFEKILVEHKFLLVGPQADADNISRAFLEWTGMKTKDLKDYTSQNTSGKATEEPTKFSETTHSAASSAVSGSKTFAEAATNVGQAINAGMASIGSFVGSKIGTKGMLAGAEETDPEPEPKWKAETKETLNDSAEAASIVGSGIVDCAKHAGGQVSDTTSKLVEHNYGSDAKEVKEQVGTTMQNVGSVGVTAVLQSSAILHGAQVGHGAVSKE